MSTGGAVDPSLSTESKTEQFPCPGCSAGMIYDPAAHSMKCPYCGATKEVVQTATSDGIPLNPLGSALEAEQSGSVRPLSEKALEVHCDSCGSAVVFEPPEVAGLCPFCGVALVTEPKTANAKLPPDAVLPVQVPKEQAQEEVRQWLRSRWFAPNALKRLASQEAIQGVYLPFWSYNADTQSSYVGERGTHYYVTETYTETDSDGNTVQKTREVQHTSWSYASGCVSLSFNNLLVAASKSVQEKRLNELEPWTFDKLCRYDSEYLAGFKAQHYQVELSEGFKVAEHRMAGPIDHAVRCDIGGDDQRVNSIQTQYLNATYRHLLLPVWIGSYRFKGEIFQVVVNASTGEVQGERPYSFWKISSLVAAILALLLGLLFYYNRPAPVVPSPIDQPAPIAAPVQEMPSPPPLETPPPHKGAGQGSHHSRRHPASS